jgi:hypothetical protein
MKPCKSSQASRRAFMRTAMGLLPAAVALSACDASGPSLRQVPTFYISASGNDDHDGLRPESAWATIQRANASLPADGSVVKFRRGDVFYGELTLPRGCVVEAYGAGVRPTLAMYKLLNRAAGWVEDSESVWKINLGSPATHDGYTATSDANIGFLMVDGHIKAALKFSLDEVVEPWDFYCDIANHTLYVRAFSNPALLSQDIKAATNGDKYGASGTIVCCDIGDNAITGIHVTGTGGCGIRGSGSDVRIDNCLIDYIGGSRLTSVAGNTRYGNGIENWTQARNWTIQTTEIAHVYDAAWTAQGRHTNGGTVSLQDITFKSNYVHDCGQSLEFWSESNTDDSPGFVRIVVEGNLCVRAGYGAFADVRPDQNARVHLLTYELQTPVDVTIQNNTFEDSWGAYSYHLNQPPDGYKTRNNSILLKPETKMQYQYCETVEQAAQWQAATKLEISSKISVLP